MRLMKQVRVVSYDTFGNMLSGPMNTSTWTVQAFADTDSTVPGVALTLPAASVVDNRNGSHTLQLRLTQAGDYLLWVTMGGVHAAGSPFVITATVSSVVTANPLTQSGTHTHPLRLGNTVRSFPTHGQLSAAQGSSTNVSR